jgi:ABC-type branched-subunit amino acid transport system ATPase component
VITLLEAKHITKRFGGLTALSDVSLTIRKGEVYGLIGPNGAGKTTFFNVLTGAYVPEEGEIVFNGTELPTGKPHEVVAAGIARTFQNIRLFRELTALENVMAGHHIRSRANPFSILLQTRHARRKSASSPSAPSSCSATWASSALPIPCRKTSPTAINAAWRSPAPWPPSPSYWPSTNRRRA